MKILVIRGGGVGDFILTLPTLKALKSIRPQGTLHLVGHPWIAVVADRQGYFDSVSDLADRRIAQLFSRSPPENGEWDTFLAPFQLAVSFLDDAEGSLRRNLARRIPRRIFITPPDGRLHAAEHFHAQLGELPATEGFTPPGIEVPPQARREAENWLSARGLTAKRPLVAVHPGSGGRRKNWPAENFAAVIKELINHQIQVLLIEGEADHEALSAVRGAVGHPGPSILQDTSLPALAALLTHASALLGNDSGISHLAAAVGIPVLALFGPTSPFVWRPLGACVQAVRFEEADSRRIARALIGLAG